MTDRLRTPLFVIAAIVLIIAIGMEAGSALVKPRFDEAAMRAQASKQLAGSDMSKDDRNQVVEDMIAQGRKSEKPPGTAIPYMAVLDALVLFGVLLMGASLILPDGLHGRIQGIVTLIVSIIALLAAIVLILKAFVELVVMVSLFLAPPFGTLAYLAKWGFFDRGGAGLVLGMSMLLKVAFAILMVLAHQRVLQNKGLVLIVLTTVTLHVHNFPAARPGSHHPGEHHRYGRRPCGDDPGGRVEYLPVGGVRDLRGESNRLTSLGAGPPCQGDESRRAENVRGAFEIAEGGQRLQAGAPEHPPDLRRGMHPLVNRLHLLLQAPRKGVGDVHAALDGIVGVPAEEIEIPDPQFPLRL